VKLTRQTTRTIAGKFVTTVSATGKCAVRRENHTVDVCLSIFRYFEKINKCN